MARGGAGRPHVGRALFARGDRAGPHLQGLRACSISRKGRWSCSRRSRWCADGEDALRARACVDVRHHGRARLADRAAGAAPAREPGRHRALHGHARHRQFPRRLRPDRLGQRHLQPQHRHAQGAHDPAREHLRGRHPRQHGGRDRRGRRGRSGGRAGALLPEDRDRPGASRRGRRPPGRRSRSAFRSTASG